mmetsp:Transcript_34602/g.76055  ORF Transcript_34602/g.76055 Transcript_34602/m.76055 type:complete len:233 (-) Transcript_34602:366-1064(-)
MFAVSERRAPPATEWAAPKRCRGCQARRGWTTTTAARSPCRMETTIGTSDQALTPERAQCPAQHQSVHACDRVAQEDLQRRSRTGVRSTELERGIMDQAAQRLNKQEHGKSQRCAILSSRSSNRTGHYCATCSLTCAPSNIPTLLGSRAVAGPACVQYIRRCISCRPASLAVLALLIRRCFLIRPRMPLLPHTALALLHFTSSLLAPSTFSFLALTTTFSYLTSCCRDPFPV